MATHSHQLPEAIEAFAEPPDAPPGSRFRLEERVRAGKKHYGLRMTALIDNEQRDVQTLYGAGPKRLLIVDSSGRIVVDSGNLPTEDFPWERITGWLEGYHTWVSTHSAQKQP